MKESISHNHLLNQKRWIQNYRFRPRVIERGKVISVGDGIVWIEGLPSTGIDEILQFEDGSKAMVFHLTTNLVGAILLEQTESLTAGTEAKHVSHRLTINTGDALIGRVIDPMGRSLDGRPQPELENVSDLDISSPPIVSRDFVKRPLLSGNRIVDTLVPIGKGQRQLLIGDNGLGKSSLALDIVANQRGKDVICVYVLIGQKRSSVLSTISFLKKAQALDYSVLVVAEATALSGLQYLAPFAGCAIAEYWMGQGKDTLVVYDDLMAHANCYRELSLLLRRPPGREAYPADIFFLHSRLLERSTCLAQKAGGGSMTALPIIETKGGEIASYIPTNLISITDGQIYFEISLFFGGYLPAIDITKSVSRVGGQAQPEEIKREAGRMKLDYLRFLELEIFTRFGAKLEKEVQRVIHRGRLLREIFKQSRLSAMELNQQMAWLVAFNDGLLDDFSVDEIGSAVKGLFQWIEKEEIKFTASRNQWKEILGEWKNKEKLNE